MHGDGLGNTMQLLQQQVRRLQQAVDGHDAPHTDLLDALRQLERALQGLATLQTDGPADQNLSASRDEFHLAQWRCRQEFGFLPDGCLATDSRGVIDQADAGAGAMLGHPRDELIGRPVTDFFLEECRPALRNRLARLKPRGEIRGWLARLVRPDVPPLDVAVYVKAEEPTAHGEGRLLWLLHDVRLQLEAEARCHETDQRYRRLVETSPDGLIVHQEGRIIFANPQAAQLLGASTVEQLIGTLVLDRVHPDSRAAVERRLRQVDYARPMALHEERLLRLDGTQVEVEVAAAPVLFDGKPAIQVLFRDIGDRKRLQREVVEISEIERQRIGRDLHDVLGQNLTGISFISKVLEKKLQERGLDEAADAHEISTLASEGMAHARALARGLFPVDLTPQDLPAALKALAMDVHQMFGVTCRLDIARNPIDLPDHRAAAHLYHVAQEAVTNAAKHGKAASIEIGLAAENGCLVLRVRDNGTGFSTQQGRPGIGLRIMRHRASLLGGQLSVQSTPAQGTQVTCSVPLHAED